MAADDGIPHCLETVPDPEFAEACEAFWKVYRPSSEQCSQYAQLLHKERKRLQVECDILAAGMKALQAQSDDRGTEYARVHAMAQRAVLLERRESLCRCHREDCCFLEHSERCFSDKDGHMFCCERCMLADRPRVAHGRACERVDAHTLRGAHDKDEFCGRH
jgi:hypothetical protein